MPDLASLPSLTEQASASRHRILALCGLIAAVVFGLDLVLPLGVAEAVPYVLVVLISIWSPQDRDTILVASACTALTILGFFLSPEGTKEWIGVVNRSLAVFAIWVTAVLGLKIQAADVSARAKSQILSGILTNMPTVVFRLDEHGYMTQTMGRGLQRIGVKHSEVAGRNGLEPPPDVRARLLQSHVGQTVFYESHGHDRGTPWWFLNCITSASSEGTGAIGFGIDITDRKHAERRLATHHAVTTVLEQYSSFDEAAPRILQAICENLGWDLGAMWAIDGRGDRLRCQQVWHMPGKDLVAFESRTKDLAFARGEGLPGRVWESAEPAWIPDVVEDPNFPRAQAAAQENLHAGLAFPIKVKTQVRCVMEFFSRDVEEPDSELLKMFAALGAQIGYFIDYHEVLASKGLGPRHS